MAQLDRPLRRGESTPKTPSKPTMEQMLRDGEGSWWLSSATSGSSPSFAKNHDPEEDHVHHQKKSVLSKVKEKARKLKHSLSGKKRHNEDGNTTPSWGVSLEDYEDEEEEEDAEYLGAPMYESELAPDSYKETAKQHPRASPVIYEKHVLLATGSIHDNNKESPISPNNKLSQSESNDKLSSPPKTITETVTEKLAPAYASVAETTHSIASKIPGLTISAPTEAPQTRNSSSPLAPLTTSARTPPSPQTFSAQLAPQPLSAPTAAAASTRSFSGLLAPEPRKQVSSSGGGGGDQQQVWDKGVSVKEYLLHKFEPGEDDRALSRAISEAISPRKTLGEMSVVDKVREAVSSLLRNDSILRSQSKPTVDSPSKPAFDSPSKPEVSSLSIPEVSCPSKTVRLTRSATKAPSHTPFSSNAPEVREEENHGRILQTN